MTPYETSGYATQPFTRRTVLAFALTALSIAPHAHAVGPDPQCGLSWSLLLEQPPPTPLFGAAPALARQALGSVRARLHGLDARAELAPDARGLALHLYLSGPASRRDELARMLAAAGDHLRAQLLERPAPTTATADRATDGPTDAAWAAFHAIHPPRAGDRDPALAEPRLHLVVAAASPSQTHACNTPAPPPPIALTAASPITIGPRPGAPAGTPPRLHFIAPANLSDTDARLLETLVNHSGTAIHRALVDPPVRATHVHLQLLPGSGLLALGLDLPPATDWRTHLHEATRSLTRPTFSPADVRGAARLAGIDPDHAATVARRLAALLDPQSGVWVHVAAPAPPPSPPPVLDAAARDLFAAISVDLRCPAPSETHPPDERLAARFQLDAAAWRALAREVAAAPDVSSWLEREIADRCEELKRLRRLVDTRRFTSIYQTYACTIRPDPDPERRWRNERALMQRHRLDSSLLRPILGMAAADAALERIARDIDARCPPPGATPR